MINDSSTFEDSYLHLRQKLYKWSTPWRSR